MYLTFDDGPDPAWTPRVLEALAETGARATFFVIAPLARRYPGLVDETLAAGHAVGFHCTDHVRHTQRARTEVEQDTRSGLADLKTLGVEPRLWRPPWGVAAPWTKQVADNFGLQLTLWTADTHDWRGDRAAEMFGRVGPTLRPGSVVLMHDGLGPGARRAGCGETVALTRRLVGRIRSLGCKPAPMVPAAAGPGKETA